MGLIYLSYYVLGSEMMSLDLMVVPYFTPSPNFEISVYFYLSLGPFLSTYQGQVAFPLDQRL